MTARPARVADFFRSERRPPTAVVIGGFVTPELLIMPTLSGRFERERRSQ